MKALVNNIIKQLNDVQEGRIWIGENFNKKLNAISEEEAFTRPMPSLHSIAEIMAHLTAWRKETVLKINTGTGRLTDDSPENWQTNDKLKQIGWEKIKQAYQNSLTELVNLIQNREDDFLSETYFDADFKGRYNYLFVIEGMLHHDIYHLGQIGILTKMIKQNTL